MYLRTCGHTVFWESIVCLTLSADPHRGLLFLQPPDQLSRARRRNKFGILGNLSRLHCMANRFRGARTHFDQRDSTQYVV